MLADIKHAVDAVFSATLRISTQRVVRACSTIQLL